MKVLVNPNQRGNVVLSFIKKIPWEHANIPADYQVGANSGVLFLSLKYHRLKPEYIYERMKSVAPQYMSFKVVLCLVDVDDHQQALRELTKACLFAGPEEAGRYIETFKVFELKPPDLIKERVDSDHFSKLSDCLVQVKSVNKTDVVTLVSNFGVSVAVYTAEGGVSETAEGGSFKDIVEASPEELSILPGFGDQKVKRLVEAVNSPFLIDKS